MPRSCFMILDSVMNHTFVRLLRSGVHSCTFRFRVLLYGLFIAAFTGTSLNVQAQKSHPIRKIVLDAGHGGKDPGCHGLKNKEKDVALSIILKLGNLITNNFPDVQVIYTRDKDVFVELHERAEIANRNKADFFISVHCNANKSQGAYGAETYAMGLHRTADNLNVSKRENSAVLMEEDYSVKYDGFNPNSPEANIIFTLYQNAYLDQSLEMASRIQNQFKETAKRSDRGVKQAGFLVLYKTAMPSLLIETGFLTNSDDEAFLGTEKGQEQMAQSIFRAFSEYKNQFDKKIPQQEIKLIEVKNEKTPEAPALQVIDLSNSESPVNSETNSNHADHSGTEIPAVQVNKNDQQVNSGTIKNPYPPGVIFGIQIASSPSSVPLNSPRFKGLPVREYNDDSIFKYTVGAEKDVDTVTQLQSEIRKKGFADAFVVAFLNGNKIPVSQAIKLIKNNKSL